jgi:hypothetical protein
MGVRLSQAEDVEREESPLTEEQLGDIPDSYDTRQSSYRAWLAAEIYRVTHIVT